MEEVVRELADPLCPLGMDDCPHHCPGRSVRCGDYCCDWARVECRESGPVCCDNGDCGCSEDNCQDDQDRVFLAILEKIKKAECEAEGRADCGNDCRGLSAQCPNGMCCRCSGGGCLCCDDGVTCSWSDYDCTLNNMSDVFARRIKETTHF